MVLLQRNGGSFGTNDEGGDHITLKTKWSENCSSKIIPKMQLGDLLEFELVKVNKITIVWYISSKTIVPGSRFRVSPFSIISFIVDVNHEYILFYSTGPSTWETIPEFPSLLVICSVSNLQNVSHNSSKNSEPFRYW